MRVCVDIDNVTLNWQQAWVSAYELWFGGKVEAKHKASWTGFFDGTHFGTVDEFWHWMDLARVWADMPPVPGALGGLYELRHLGHDIIFCTARPVGSARKEAELFARSQGCLVEFRDAHSKHLTKASLWVDDSPEVIENLMAHGKTAVVFDQPWNRGVKASFRARSWSDVLEIVDELEPAAPVAVPV